MANQKISELTQGTPLDTDVVPYVDLVTGTTKKALKSQLKGAQGDQGAQGATGAQGSQGSQGAVGSQGAQGSQGATGAQGSTGSQGATGAQGAQGYQGNTGDTGPQGSTGAQGETGSQGPQGYQGDTGPQGTQGDQGVAGGAMSWQGEYSAGTAYDIEDAVVYEGQSYICIQAGTGQTPSTSPLYWTLFAQKGAQGDQGAQGATGAQGDQGDVGSQGSTGATGAQGVQGVYPAATTGEVTTGTDNTKAVTPDNLAGSDYGKRVVEIQCFASGTNTAVGDGAAFFRIPASMNGWNLVAVAANVYAAGTTGTTDIQIRNVTDSQDMLSTKITIDSTETDSSTAATPAVINTTYDDVATGDKIAIDVDAVSTTPATGLVVELTFQLP